MVRHPEVAGEAGPRRMGARYGRLRLKRWPFALRGSPLSRLAPQGDGSRVYEANNAFRWHTNEIQLRSDHNSCCRACLYAFVSEPGIRLSRAADHADRAVRAGRRQRRGCARDPAAARRRARPDHRDREPRRRRRQRRHRLCRAAEAGRLYRAARRVRFRGQPEPVRQGLLRSRTRISRRSRNSPNSRSYSPSIATAA